MAKLVANVHVKDPRTHQMVQLEAGSEPDAELAALVTNPDAWEDGKPPAAAKSASDPDNKGDDGDKPAAKRAARKPARGRDAAGEGSSGD